MKLYSSKTNENGTKRVTLFGIRIYKKWKSGNSIKRAYLGGIIKTALNNYDLLIKKKFYFCGIRFFTYNKDNPNCFWKKLSNKLDNIYYNMPVLIKASVVHNYLLKYKNSNVNKDVILFAGGPTVRYYKNEIKQAKKCGVNGIFNTVNDLNYLFIEDLFLWDISQNKLADEYCGNNCEKFYGILPQRRLNILNTKRNFTDRIPCENIYNAQANVFLIEDIYNGNWAIDIEVEPFGDFGGSVFSALQFIAYTNPRRIYLCGNDCSQETNIYLNKGIKKGNHSAKIKNYISFKNFIKRVYPSIEVISINPIGLKGIFKDVYTQSYINEHPEIRSELGENIEILNQKSEVLI